MQLIEGATFAGSSFPCGASVIHASFTPDAQPLREQFGEQLVIGLRRRFPAKNFELAFGDRAELAIRAQPHITDFAVVATIIEHVASELGIALKYCEIIKSNEMLRTIMNWVGMAYGEDVIRLFGLQNDENPTP